MFMKKEILLMCGPTALPENAIKAMDRQVMFHRSKEFEAITAELEQNLKKVFQTQNTVMQLTGSGTSAMEAAISNCFSAGEEVVVVVLGVFSERMAKIAEAFGLKVTRVVAELGCTVTPQEVMPYVTENTKGVIVIHNESATGVTTDIKAFGEALKDTQALLIVDSVSGLGALEMRMDEWHVDVLFTGSQKALMGPPGLSLIALSDKAWAACEKATLPHFYLDLKVARDYALRNQHPWTPAVYAVIGLNESVKTLVAEGMENVYERTDRLSAMLVEGLDKLGIKLFAKERRYASKSVNTFTFDKSKALVAALKEEYGIQIYGGQDTLADTTFRVGTMGYVCETDIQALLYATEQILSKLK